MYVTKYFKDNCPIDDPFYIIEIVSENDFIDHNNKGNPYINSYNKQRVYYNDNIEFLDIEYNFNYIKYDMDNGIFYQKYNSLDLITFSNVYSFQLNSFIPGQLSINIDFKINKSNYDHYIRTYTKIQSLLADVANIIHLLMLIGTILSSFLLDKQMSRDILQTIILNNKILDSDINLTFENDKFNKNEEIKMTDFSSNRFSRNKFKSSSLIINGDFTVKEKNLKN